MRDAEFIFLFIFFSIFGLFFFTAGILVAIRSKKERGKTKKYTAEALAEVIDIDDENNRVLLEFLANGEIFRTTASFSRKIWKPLEKGGQVTVRYNPKARSQCYIKGYREANSGSNLAAIFIIIGLIILSLIAFITYNTTQLN